MTYTYDLAILGLPVSITARNVREARVQALRRWLDAVGYESRHYPVVPTVRLLGTTDSRPAVRDELELANRDEELERRLKAQVYYLDFDK